jgi:hypothetical protein
VRPLLWIDFFEQLRLEVENTHTPGYMCVSTFVRLLHLGAIQGSESAETSRAFVVVFMPELWMFGGRLHQCWQVYVLALTHEGKVPESVLTESKLVGLSSGLFNPLAQ